MQILLLFGGCVEMLTSPWFIIQLVTILLARSLSQVEMAGSSIFDYVHQGDHAEVAEQLGLSLTGHSQGMASPSSSDDGTTHGTMNPDGKSDDFTAHLTKSFKRAFLFCSLVVDVCPIEQQIQRLRAIVLHSNEVNAHEARMSVQTVDRSSRKSTQLSLKR